MGWTHYFVFKNETKPIGPNNCTLLDYILQFEMKKKNIIDFLLFCLSSSSSNAFSLRNAQNALPTQPPSGVKNREKCLNFFSKCKYPPTSEGRSQTYLAFPTAIPLTRASGADKLRHSLVTTLTLWHFATTTCPHIVAVAGRCIPAGC